MRGALSYIGFSKATRTERVYRRANKMMRAPQRRDLQPLYQSLDATVLDAETKYG